MATALLHADSTRRTWPIPFAPSARVAAAGLILAFAVANVAYLLLACPHDLAPDEAHYWDWSRHLDWAYYSKGPLVAWLIRGGCELFGNTMPAVRLPAVLCNALLLAAVYRLAADAFGPRVGLATVAAAVTVPTLSAGAVLMTIDAPFLACWAWAAVFVRNALTDDRIGWWLAAGTVAAVGVLAKYTMLVFPGCVAFYLLHERDWRIRSLGRGLWLMAVVTASGLLPILGWNAANEWAGFRHLAALGGADPVKSAGFRPGGLLDYLAGQLGFYAGVWAIPLMSAAVRFAPRSSTQPAVRFLWWLAVPIWLTFAVVSVAVKPQANWPAAAAVTGFPLAVGWLLEVRRPWAKRLAVAGVVIGLVGTVAVRFPSVVRPALASVAGSPTEHKPVPLRRLDPTCRLAGWRTLADAVDQVRDRVRAETGEEPLVAGMNWGLPGELGFYCRGNPTVYSFGPGLKDRHSQYDLWRPNPVADAQAFRGRAFVYVGDAPVALRRAFDRVGPPVEVLASDGGIPVAEWTVWGLVGFRGFAPVPEVNRGY
jgi:4-amino-4-deoxy-L-arabinose transferase-like glycosyltransferase